MAHAAEADGRKENNRFGDLYDHVGAARVPGATRRKDDSRMPYRGRSEIRAAHGPGTPARIRPPNGFCMRFSGTQDADDSAI